MPDLGSGIYRGGSPSDPPPVDGSISLSPKAFKKWFNEYKTWKFLVREYVPKQRTGLAADRHIHG